MTRHTLSRLLRPALIALALFALSPPMALATSFEAAVEELHGTGCSTTYAHHVRQKQAALLTIYATSIEEGALTEHMNPIDQCLEKLKTVFRSQTFSLSIPGSSDVAKVIQQRLEEAAEKLCRETVESLAHVKQPWQQVWEYAQSAARSHSIDWSILDRSITLGNQTLRNTVNQRLQNLLHNQP